MEILTEAAAKFSRVRRPSRRLRTVVGSTMGKTSVILRHLYSLKTSSLDVTRYLHLLIQFDGEEKYLTNLKEPELTRLLDFLDKVRAASSTFRRLRDRPLQALDIIPVNDGVAQACLKKLQAICADSCTFPSSYIISGELAKVDGSRINVGKGLVLWEGTYRDKDVYIMPFGDPAEVEGQVQGIHIWYCRSLPLMGILRRCRSSSI